MVMDSSTPSEPRAATTSTRSRRRVGSPPVMRTVRTPRPIAIRRARISSSRPSTSSLASQARPSSGMQYRQRKLHLSVTETRRSRTTRPKLSTISATGRLLQEGTASGVPTQRPPSAQSSSSRWAGRLVLVDQLPAAGERLGPVGRRGGHDHARLGRPDHPDPVGQVDGPETVAAGHRPGHPLHLGPGRRRRPRSGARRPRGPRWGCGSCRRTGPSRRRPGRAPPGRPRPATAAPR